MSPAPSYPDHPPIPTAGMLAFPSYFPYSILFYPIHITFHRKLFLAVLACMASGSNLRHHQVPKPRVEPSTVSKASGIIYLVHKTQFFSMLPRSLWFQKYNLALFLCPMQYSLTWKPLLSQGTSGKWESLSAWEMATLKEILLYATRRGFPAVPAHQAVCHSSGPVLLSLQPIWVWVAILRQKQYF